MNMQPGQMAILTRNSTRCPCVQCLIGRVVIRVTAVVRDSIFDGPAWAYEGRLHLCKCGDTQYDFLDADLTRLDPPGAEDEASAPRVVETDYAHA